MTYVMSDIHGCYGKYINMLEKIKFTDEDTLYILGDLIDRGNENMKVVLDVMSRENVHVIRGNHDDMADKFFSSHINKPTNEELFQDVNEWAWFHNGRDKTFDEFFSLPLEDRNNIINFWSSLPLKTVITVAGKKYHLSHSVPEKEEMDTDRDMMKDCYIWGEPDFEDAYNTDMTMIVGHTPTKYVNFNGEYKIFKGESIIDVDCGAVFGGKLACLCLDDNTEYYVEED